MTDLARALDAHAREAPEGLRLLLVTARHRSSRVAARVERSLRRVFDALGGDETAAALLGGAVAALHGGPSVDVSLACSRPRWTKAPPDGHLDRVMRVDGCGREDGGKRVVVSVHRGTGARRAAG